MKEVINNINNKYDVKTTFIEACSNKDFKNYVYSLGIKEEILMNYTFRLLECFQELTNYNNNEEYKNKVVGYLLTPEGNGNIINFSYIKTDEKLKEEKDKFFDNYFLIYNMPKAIKEASFKDIYKDDKLRLPIIKYFKLFLDNYDKGEYTKGLYLYGSFGSGKTYLISALFNELIKRKVFCTIVYYPEFLRSLKSSFKDDFDDIFNNVKTSQMLLIDDIGAENVTAWGRDEILSSILQYRMEEKLPTFFTSNLSIGELEIHLSQTNGGNDKLKARRIIERVKQLTSELNLISKNRRN